MSEEEKKAIKNVRRFANILMKNKQVTIENDNASNELIVSLYKVLELLEGKNAVINTFKHTEKVLTEQIDEQQKEIEELKEMKPLQDLIDTNIIIADYSHNYISKDKIRKYFMHEIAFKKRLQREKQKIDKYNRGRFDTIEEILELLEEN